MPQFAAREARSHRAGAPIAPSRLCFAAEQNRDYGGAKRTILPEGLRCLPVHTEPYNPRGRAVVFDRHRGRACSLRGRILTWNSEMPSWQIGPDGDGESSASADLIVSAFRLNARRVDDDFSQTLGFDCRRRDDPLNCEAPPLIHVFGHQSRAMGLLNAFQP